MIRRALDCTRHPVRLLRHGAHGDPRRRERRWRIHPAQTRWRCALLPVARCLKNRDPIGRIAAFSLAASGRCARPPQMASERRARLLGGLALSECNTGARSRCPGERNGAWHRSAEAAAEKHYTAPAMCSFGQLAIGALIEVRRRAGARRIRRFNVVSGSTSHSFSGRMTVRAAFELRGRP
jgi:hypothetical protein